MKLCPGTLPCCLHDHFLHGHSVDLDFTGVFQVLLRANHLFPLTLGSRIISGKAI